MREYLENKIAELEKKAHNFALSGSEWGESHVMVEIRAISGHT